MVKGHLDSKRKEGRKEMFYFFSISIYSTAFLHNLQYFSINVSIHQFITHLSTYYSFDHLFLSIHPLFLPSLLTYTTIYVSNYPFIYPLYPFIYPLYPFIYPLSIHLSTHSTHSQTHMHTYKYTKDIHTYEYTHTHTHKHSHIHIHSYTFTQ